MSYNPKVSSHKFESQPFSKGHAESSGNLQGRQVSDSSSSSDTSEKVSGAALGMLAINCQEDVFPCQISYTIFQIDWAALMQEKSEYACYHVADHYCIEAEGFNINRLMDLLKGYGPYITALNFIDPPTHMSEQFQPLFLKSRENWVTLFKWCPRLTVIKTNEIQLVHEVIEDPKILKQINQLRKEPIRCPAKIPEYSGKSIYLPTFSVFDDGGHKYNRKVPGLVLASDSAEEKVSSKAIDILRTESSSTQVNTQTEVAKHAHLSNDSWVEVAKFLDLTALKTSITTLTTTINKDTPANIHQIIQKMKALLLSKEHGLRKEKVQKLISQCGSYITKLNLKGLDFNQNELQEIVALCPNLQEIEINKFEKTNLFGLLQECGKFIVTLDIRVFNFEAEKLKQVFQLCPNINTLKTCDLEILEGFTKDPAFLKEIHSGILDIYHQAFIEFIKTYKLMRPRSGGLGMPLIMDIEPEFIKKELMENLNLCHKIRKFTVPDFLTLTEIQTVLSNCPHLVELTLVGGSTSDELRTILASCQKLMKLYSSNWNILKCIECIPPTVKELDLTGIELTNDLIRQLPPGLTHLKLTLKTLNLSSVALKRFTSLEVLEIEDSEALEYYAYMREERNNHLELTEQAFVKSQQAFIKSLPSSLKELNIVSLSMCQLDVSQFPKSLQKLSLNIFPVFCKDKPLFIQSDKSLFPASLTSVKIESYMIGCPRGLNSNDFQALPQTLKSLTIQDHFNRSLNDLLPLPRDLEELNLIHFSFQQQTINKELPSGLKLLSLIPHGDFLRCDFEKLIPKRSKQLKIAIKHSVCNDPIIAWCKKNNVTLINE